MVKGISRRVIVVRSPDPRFFEQAIFLLKEDAFHSEGVTAEQVVSEAREAAAGYVRRTQPPKQHRWRLRIPGWAWFLIGSSLTAILLQVV